MSILKAQDKTVSIPGCGGHWKEDFSFIQAADCQFGMDWVYARDWGYDRPDYDTSDWSREIKWSKTMVNMINSMSPAPRFVIICGDMLDAWPGKSDTSRRVRTEQYKDFVDVFSSLTVPLVCVCGNHDVGNTPTQQTLQRYRSEFGDDWFSFECDGMFCIVLNSQYYKDCSRVPEQAEEQERWLDEQLKVAESGNYKYSVVFQHIPWFFKSPEEAHVRKTLPDKFRSEMLEKFHRAGVSKIFCGHFHLNGGGWYKDMELVVTSSSGVQLGGDKPGFRKVFVRETEITHQYLELDNIE